MSIESNIPNPCLWRSSVYKLPDFSSSPLYSSFLFSFVCLLFFLFAQLSVAQLVSPSISLFVSFLFTNLSQFCFGFLPHSLITCYNITDLEMEPLTARWCSGTNPRRTPPCLPFTASPSSAPPSSPQAENKRHLNRSTKMSFFRSDYRLSSPHATTSCSAHRSAAMLLYFTVSVAPLSSCSLAPPPRLFRTTDSSLKHLSFGL